MAPGDPAVLAAVAVERAEALAASPGVTGLVGFVVTGRAGGDARVDVRVVDGRPVGVGEGDGATCTFTATESDAVAMAGGALEPSVAFMRGRLKTAGDNGLVLAVLGATAQEGFAAWLFGLAERRSAQ